MTFSIVGRCLKTGQLGVAICSSSISVGSRCPWVRSGVGVVITQNLTYPYLGPIILDNLERYSVDPKDAIKLALEHDKWFEYRQLCVIDNFGRMASFSGKRMLGISSVEEGTQCIACGNLLSRNNVINVMTSVFEKTDGHLGDRLIKAITSGLKEGGEAGDVHSSALIIVDKYPWPIVDLRVDWVDIDPIRKLNDLWYRYKPEIGDYLIRALNPSEAPSYGVPGDE